MRQGVCHLVNTKLGSPTSQALEKIGMNFAKNGDRLMKISNWETIFLATTLQVTRLLKVMKKIKCATVVH